MASNSIKKSAPNERYKIKVSGLPRFYALADPLLQEFLKCIRHELKLNCIYARFVRKGNAWLYLTFPTADEQQRALAALKRYTWKGRTLVSMMVTSDILKRKTDGSEDEVISYDSKKQKIDIPISEQVLMSTIPYHSLSYAEQLKQKNEEAHSLVSRLHEILMKRSHQLANWCIQRKNKLNRSLPFVLDKIRPSPVIDGYRNKYEFSVGINPDTETVAVGIRVQDRRDGIHHVGPCDGLRHLPKPMVSLVKDFEQFVISQMENWDLWYHLIVRMNHEGEIMVTVSTNPNKKDYATKRAEELKKSIINCFTKTKENVVSVYFQIHGDKPISDTVGIPSKSDLLWGKDHIKEKLLNLQLEITPVTYFRINSAAAEILCHAVAELTNVDSDTTLLDLFCGSGSLALTLAPKCKEVIAVELIESNIIDAKKYAALNNIKNCEFIAGKIEDIIQSILCRLSKKKVVVILDPPRTGIDPTLVRTLRQFKEASRFIYVCSNHKLPLKNLLDFSSLSGHSSDPDPIIPVRIIPIDMTPHTLRSELVILCERFDLNSLKKDYQHGKNFPPFVRGQTSRTVRFPSNSPLYSRNVAAFASQSFINRSTAKASVPPRPVIPSKPPPTYCSPAQVDTFYTEDRYSSFRRDFENAIDSSYPSFSSITNDFLPLDMVKKIEERAFREGLTRGIQQSAFQVGYQAGLRTSTEKLQNWDELPVRNFMTDNTARNWETPPPINSVSPPTNWNNNSISPGSAFQNWNRTQAPNLSTSADSGDGSPINQNSQSVFWR